MKSEFSFCYKLLTFGAATLGLSLACQAAPADPFAPDQFAAAHSGFVSKLAQAQAPPGAWPKIPVPPASLFVRNDYVNSQKNTLPAFVSPDPGDGKKHPAIVWITGGDSTPDYDFWTPKPKNDQSASAYRKAGMIMMVPSLRGGFANTGKREYFLHEIDDIVAAAKHLASLPYVDSQQIYLGGHSTGGTLVLLTAQLLGSSKAAPINFRAAFSFGPVSAATEQYGKEWIPFGPLKDQNNPELRLRGPIFWMASIKTPTYIIEGERGNYDTWQDLCAEGAKNPAIHCHGAKNHDHFSVLDAISRILASNIAANADPHKLLDK